MVTPTVFHVGYTIVQGELSDDMKERWSHIMNRKTLLLIYAYSLFNYIIGWSDKGITSLELVSIGESEFYFPVYGELSWIFNSTIIFFILTEHIAPTYKLLHIGSSFHPLEIFE